MSYCEKEELKLFDVELGSLIVVGMIITYTPQIAKLLRTKNSYGISPLNRLICIVSQSFLIFNVFLLQRKIVKCSIKGEFDILYTLGSLVGFFQVFVQFCCVATIAVLFVKYYPRHNQDNPTDEKIKDRRVKEWKVTIASIYIFTITFTILFAFTLYAMIVEWNKDHIDYIAGVFGVTSAILAIFQYLPQIRKTYIDKAPGAVSILTLLIQCPGALVMAICLIIQPGTNWTSSTSYFVSFLLEGTILVLCIYYRMKNKKRDKQNKKENKDNIKKLKEEEEEKILIKVSTPNEN
ncbi:hypothetical protein BCR32DRAFT_291824 [Anaeromyces robustus]|uniref:PQ-loop-domain-containing protein n=1 Tax=Anaeromyces robustus TaxID=1754192 RepID=A0A1Y1XD97_9FUNG|nr:hypothetical protein BCR32DRAFT_291824 [Anaeromyces robustus]|eukprot:ORX83709.1 hypothetical protein BCR32DRAFT_291824 [Anaeromyces robustus]